ncbi:HlyD family secretion protein [Thalassotalea profundi]|uniref:ABC transporter permease n=1 Tax=Thalassotalea profundi TaxID=2036687 RepID=A0ABQ3J6A7_9GAMM|nr:HlyD family efflux transporter periplasmic adaptor subunit [Thalassotalea profundi]GHF02776.1 ABC transporter permease [Thalassotalea profundi]
MDIIKPKSRYSPYKKVTKISIFIVVSFIAIWQSNIHLNKVTLAKKDLLIAKVQKGELLVTVDGYGNLVSSKVQLLTSDTRATVAEIILKPGAQIKKGDVIVKLSNPELTQQFNGAEQELALYRANLRQLKLNNKREMLNESSLHTQLFAEYESAKLKREAEARLVEKGIVSQLTFRESELNEKQLEKRLEILLKRIDQLALVHEEAINIQQERINQQQGLVDIAKNKVQNLNIRASLDGVVQKLSVVLGQSLSAGEEIAIIGSTSDLKALIKIPQSKAQTIVLDQKVEIDTRQDKIEGRVVRIDPVVTENTVEIEVAIVQLLPKSARPYQNVDATIITNVLNDVLYVELPSNVKSFTELMLYKLNSTRDMAIKNKVKFGIKAGRFIEIESGLGEGEHLIISDLSNYIQQQISLN